MMDPEKQRLDYGEQLNPPPGYELCSALVTTYSLDLEALTCATLALTLGQTLEGDVSEEKLALLESIDNLKSKLLVFHNASSVHVPPKYNSLYALLEPYLTPSAHGDVTTLLLPDCPIQQGLDDWVMQLT